MCERERMEKGEEERAYLALLVVHERLHVHVADVRVVSEVVRQRAVVGGEE